MNESNIIVMLAGVILSLLFGYAPGLRPWYEALEATRKALVMAGLLLVAVVVIYLASCYTPYATGITCDEAGVWLLVRLFMDALIANQATYLMAVRPTRTRVEQVE